METKMERLKKLDELAKNDPAFVKEITELLKAKDIQGVIRLSGEHGIELEETDFAPADRGELDREELENITGRGDDDWHYCGDYQAYRCGFWLAYALWS